MAYFDLGKIAKEMEAKVLETPSTKFVISPLLTRNQAEKLSQDYLQVYNPRVGALNPEIADISSYSVVVPGRNQNA